MRFGIRITDTSDDNVYMTGESDFNWTFKKTLLSDSWPWWNPRSRYESLTKFRGFVERSLGISADIHQTMLLFIQPVGSVPDICFSVSQSGDAHCSGSHVGLRRFLSDHPSAARLKLSHTSQLACVTCHSILTECPRSLQSLVTFRMLSVLNYFLWLHCFFPTSWLTGGWGAWDWLGCAGIPLAFALPNKVDKLRSISHTRVY